LNASLVAVSIRKYPMFTVRTYRASGINAEERFATEFEGVRALQLTLEGHRKSGHTVTQQHSTYIYVVTDATGNFVQRSELIFPG
jgi:hypothetical protein